MAQRIGEIAYNGRHIDAGHLVVVQENHFIVCGFDRRHEPCHMLAVGAKEAIQLVSRG